MNIILQNIKQNRVISLLQLIDEILADDPNPELKVALLQIRFYTEDLIQTANPKLTKENMNPANFTAVARKKRRKLIGWSSESGKEVA